MAMEMFHTSLLDRIFPILETYELDALKIFFPDSTIRTALSIRYSFAYALNLDLRKYTLQVSVCTRDRPRLDHSYIFP